MTNPGYETTSPLVQNDQKLDYKTTRLLGIKRLTWGTSRFALELTKYEMTTGSIVWIAWKVFEQFRPLGFASRVIRWYHSSTRRDTVRQVKLLL